MIDEVTTSTSLELSAPWEYYRRHICEELAKWCQMCDAEESTRSSMQVGYPSVLRYLSLRDFDATCRLPLKDQLSNFFLKLENLLPEEYKECLIYALILVERGFSHGIFLNSVTVKR